jgi:hypothetical protein
MCLTPQEGVQVLLCAAGHLVSPPHGHHRAAERPDRGLHPDLPRPGEGAWGAGRAPVGTKTLKACFLCGAGEASGGLGQGAWYCRPLFVQPIICCTGCTVQADLLLQRGSHKRRPAMYSPCPPAAVVTIGMDYGSSQVCCMHVVDPSCPWHVLPLPDVLWQGLKSLDVVISSACASAVDNLAGFYFKNVIQGPDSGTPAAGTQVRSTEGACCVAWVCRKVGAAPGRHVC